ncbi:hypothetical protein ACTJKO_12370 [Curtobacterium sp. 22159]|uniref:hypothetical protein n=1 Tax=Curtobacterium sp. 22159 TaxID=3453882 RepID=UPI003F84F60D
MTDGEPGPEVLRAFGVGDRTAERLPGGRGLTWRAGDVVFRPHDGPAVTDWRADVLAALRHTPEFRSPRPVAAADGSWRAGEWEAWEWVAGAADETRVEDVILAGAAFHRAVAHIERPPFLDPAADARAGSGVEDDPWRRADSMAWGETPLPRDRVLDRLGAAFRPVRSPSQLVHGDLLGNVLFQDGHAPAVIDWPPSWRPAGSGAAIAAVDAVCWHGTPVRRLGALGVVAGADPSEWHQLLIRALVFRIATLHLLGAWDSGDAERHRPVVEALV